MIIVEYYPQENTHKSFAYQALFRALTSYYKNDINLWDSNKKNIYDIYDELKPDKLIYFSNKLKYSIDKLSLPSWNFEDWYEKKPLISDDCIYKKLDKQPEIECENICISPYSDIDKYNDTFYKMMHKTTKRFRYFGVNVFGGHKDCGFLPDSMHSLFLSSSDKVLCLSEHFAVNAFLSNKNIINYNLSQYDVDKTLASEIIKGIV